LGQRPPGPCGHAAHGQDPSRPASLLPARQGTLRQAGGRGATGEPRPILRAATVATPEGRVLRVGGSLASAGYTPPGAGPCGPTRPGAAATPHPFLLHSSPHTLQFM